MLPVHIFSVLFSLGTVFMADKEALAWLRGKKETLSEGRMRVYHFLTWSGLFALLVSGSFLSYPMLSYLLTQPLFIMKILFVGVLFVNAVLIGRLMHVALNRPFADLAWSERFPLFVSGAVSSFSWAGALILALLVFK